MRARRWQLAYVTARRDDGGEAQFELRLFNQGEYWASMLVRLGPDGHPTGARVAPRFYGLTARQARRRMLSVLEPEFSEWTVREVC